MSDIENTKYIFNKYARQYHEKYKDLTRYREGLDLLIGSIKHSSAKVLDAACGPGNLSGYLLERKPGFEITGIDISEKMITLAKEKNPAATFIQMDCRDIANLEGPFEVIVCGFGLPYLSKDDSARFIRDASELLAKGGMLYLSTMEGDYQGSGYQVNADDEALFIYYYEAEYLENLLKKYGFRIINLHRMRYPGDHGDEITDLIILASKK